MTTTAHERALKEAVENISNQYGVHPTTLFIAAQELLKALLDEAETVEVLGNIIKEKLLENVPVRLFVDDGFILRKDSNWNINTYTMAQSVIATLKRMGGV